jgi:DNA polymerase III sliding clamp (beta) subunit (PCNA family)
MKISVGRSLLTEVLDVLASHRGKVSQILGCVLVEAREGGEVAFTVSDLVTGATVEIDAQVDIPGQAAIPFDLFSEVVGGLPAGDISLELNDDVVLLKAGTFRARIKTLDPTLYPVLPEVDGTKIELEYEQLVEAINGVTYAASDAAAGFQTAIHLVADGRLMLEACDGNKFARTYVPHDGGELEDEVLVPATSMDKVLRTIAKVEGTDLVTLIICDERLIFVLNGTEMRVETFVVATSDTYPSLDQAIPISSKVKAVVANDALSAALRLAMTLNRTNVIERVKMIMDGDGIAIQAVQGQAGDAFGQVKATVEGGVAEIFVSGLFLSETISRLGTPIQIFFNGPKDPLRLTDVSNHVHVVMPIVPPRH